MRKDIWFPNNRMKKTFSDHTAMRIKTPFMLRWIFFYQFCEISFLVEIN